MRKEKQVLKNAVLKGRPNSLELPQEIAFSFCPTNKIKSLYSRKKSWRPLTQASRKQGEKQFSYARICKQYDHISN